MKWFEIVTYFWCITFFRTPIPTSELIVEDLNPNASISGSFNDSISNGPLPNGKHGSFKSAFSGSSQPGKNGFRVSFRNPSEGQSHTLFAPDEHSKKQWLAALKKVSNVCSSEENNMSISRISETDSSINCGTPNKR